MRRETAFTNEEALSALQALCIGVPVPDMANAAALLFEHFGGINWLGFYTRDGADLILGPFQGSPACVRIQNGRGVCGTALAEKRTLVVPDVHAFPGHIACDARSRSEIVVPIFRRGEVVAVLDVDSPQLDRFSPEDSAFFERAAAILAPSFGA